MKNKQPETKTLPEVVKQWAKNFWDKAINPKTADGKALVMFKWHSAEDVERCLSQAFILHYQAQYRKKNRAGEEVRNLQYNKFEKIANFNFAIHLIN